MLLVLLTAVTIAADQKSLPPLIGAPYRTALRNPFTANWQSVELREVLRTIAAEQRVAILLDRRVDPNAVWPCEFANESLADRLPKLAEQFTGGVSFPENIVYIGPRAAAGKLRTLIVHRSGELANFEPPASISKVRQHLWLKPRTVSWRDADSPREILERWQNEWDFRITNPEAIEHDLWAAATLPQVTGVAALSLVLIQFDLTWTWREGASEIELIPIPATVAIERQHKPRGKTAARQVEEWREKYPDAEFRLAGSEILVTATEEVHAELSAPRVPQKKPPADSAVVPLSRRKFTLEIKDVSARDLMAELEKSGLVFEYDAQELSDAGVDLDRLIQFNVRNLSAADFFRTVFDPLGAKCALDGVTVTLSPK